MPTIHVYSFDRPIEQKRKLVKEITEVVCKTYEVKPEIVHVFLYPSPRENIAHAGLLQSDIDKAAGK